MTRCRAALESLDSDHSAAAAWTCMHEGRGLVAIGIRRLGLGVWDGEQLAGARDVVGAGAVGKQTIVADAVESVGQDVHQEPPDELIGGERHPLVSGAAVGAVILVP